MYSTHALLMFFICSVREFLDFTSKIIVERTNVAQRASVKENEYMCHVFVRNDSLSGVLVSDHEYPQRVGQTLLSKVSRLRFGWWFICL